MDWPILYLLPYVAALLITLGVAFYAWHRRDAPVAAIFAVYAFSQASMTFGYIFELLTPTLTGKIFWDDFQWIGTLVTPFAALLFAMQHTGRYLAYKTLIVRTAAVVVFISMLFIFSDPWHHLFRPTLTLIPGTPFDALFYDFSWAAWLLFLVIYALVAASIYLLIDSLRQPQPLYRTQTIPILIGILIPVAASLLVVAGIQFTFQRDTTPVSFAIGNLIIAWGIFRYRTFDIVPVARDALIEHMQECVIVLDPKQRIVDLNPAAAELMDQPPGQILGQTATAVLPAWTELESAASQNAQIEITMPRHQEIIYLDVHATPLYDSNGRFSGSLLMLRDITPERKAKQKLNERNRELERLNNQLEQANANLQELSQVKDQFVANVSHELRTPITNLKLYLKLLSVNPGKSGSYLSTLQRETTRLESLIESLLLLSRLDRGRITLATSAVSLNALVHDYVRDRTMLASEKKLELHLRLDERQPQVYADPGLLGEVLSILLTNSFSYTPPGGTITVATHIRAEAGQWWAGFRVCDTGPGIPQEEQPRVFERFVRGRAGNTSGVSGTGLGLSIAHEIVQQHEGRIDVDSKGIPGQGACFAVWLPVPEETLVRVGRTAESDINGINE